MATPKDYQISQNTIESFLQKYASGYAGMIPENFKVALAHDVVNAVDAERAGKPPPAMTTLPPHDVAGGSFAVEMLLNSLGIYDQPNQPNRTTVEAAIPIAQQAVALANANRNVFEQFAKYWQQIGPAAEIVTTAIKKQQGT